MRVQQPGVMSPSFDTLKRWFSWAVGSVPLYSAAAVVVQGQVKEYSKEYSGTPTLSHIAGCLVAMWSVCSA